MTQNDQGKPMHQDHKHLKRKLDEAGENLFSKTENAPALLQIS